MFKMCILKISIMWYVFKVSLWLQVENTSQQGKVVSGDQGTGRLGDLTRGVVAVTRCESRGGESGSTPD